MFKSHDELKDAGYVFLQTKKCKGKRCRKLIYFYRMPNGGLVPVDPGTFAPHFRTCVSKEQFQRKPERQTREQIEIALSKPETVTQPIAEPEPQLALF